MSKKIYINYDDLANWKSKLIYEISKSFPDIEYNINDEDLKNVNLKDMWKFFEFPVFIHMESQYDIDGTEIEDEIKNVSVTTTNNCETNPEYFRQFISDNVFEIFSGCNLKEIKIIDKLNFLINEGYEINVVSNFKGKIRSCIYYFLSKYLYQGNLVFDKKLKGTMMINEINKIVEEIKENG